MRKIALILLLDGKRILLQHRDEFAERNPNQWSLFGGGIEEGETPLDAAKREFLEEMEYGLKNPQLFTTRSRDEIAEKFVYIEEYDGSPFQQHEGQGYEWFLLEEALLMDITETTKIALKKLQELTVNKKMP